MTLSSRCTVVLDLRGLHWASQQSGASAVLLRRPGVVEVAVNTVSQNATVAFDPTNHLCYPAQLSRTCR